MKEQKSEERLTPASQEAKGRFRPLARLDLGDFFVGRARGVDEVPGDSGDEAAAIARDLVGEATGRHDQPPRKPGRILDTQCRAVEFGPHFLEHVTRVFGFQPDFERTGVDERLIACDQCLPGSFVSFDATPEQLGIGVRVRG